jgi:hypothetical protein
MTDKRYSGSCHKDDGAMHANTHASFNSTHETLPRGILRSTVAHSANVRTRCLDAQTGHAYVVTRLQAYTVRFEALCLCKQLAINK